MKTITTPAELRPGMHVEISLAKTGRPPRTLHFTVLKRDGDDWLMKGLGSNPSRVPDVAPCYGDGRMVQR